MSITRRAMISVLMATLLGGAAKAEGPEQGLYERHGQKGPWAEKVTKALGSYLDSNMASTAPFMDAWAAGCRDPLVASIILRRLSVLGDVDDAQVVWDQLLKSDPPAYPGGLHRYGLCPYSISQLWLSRGEANLSEKLRDLYQQAISAGSVQGAALVRHAQVWVKVIRDPNGAMAFWNENAKELRPVQAAIHHETLYALTRIQERLLGPQAVVDFLKAEPAGDDRDGLLRAYEQQVQIAVKTKDLDKGLGHKVLVDLYPETRALRGSASGASLSTYPVRLPPFRVECEARLTGWPLIETNARRTFRLDLRYIDKALLMPHDIVQLGVRPSGMLRPDVLAIDTQGSGTTAAYVDPNAWRTLGVERWRNLLRVDMDGSVYRTVYHEAPEGMAYIPICTASRCDAEVRNVRVYAFSAVAADNGKIEEHLSAFITSCLQGSLPEANEAHDRLKALWDPVPEARPAIRWMDAQLDGLKKVLSPGGLLLCTPEEMDKAVAGDGPAWKLNGTWIEAPRGMASLRFPLMLPDVEIAGQIDVRNAPQNSWIYFAWNAAHCPGATENVVSFLPTQDSVSGYGRVFKAVTVPLSKLPGPIPFLIRARGNQAVLFVTDRTKPVLTFGIRPRSKGDFFLTVADRTAATAVRYGGLTIRSLPRTSPLDSFAENMPAAPGVSTSRPSDKLRDGQE